MFQTDDVIPAGASYVGSLYYFEGMRFEPLQLHAESDVLPEHFDAESVKIDMDLRRYER